MPAEVIPIARLLRRKPVAVAEAPVDLPEIGSALPAPRPHPARDGKLPPVAPLPAGPKLLILCGPSAGKTTWARRKVSRWERSGLLPQVLVAATNTDTVALERFLPPGTVNKPASRSTRDGLELLDALFGAMVEADPPPIALLDCGAGETALMAYLEGHPKAFERLKAKGVAVVEGWFWTPRVLDLALFKAFRDKGFKPSATFLALNEALCGGEWENYEPLRSQPVYRRALEEGAAELWTPALSPPLANLIERRGIPFHLARDGTAVGANREPKPKGTENDKIQPPDVAVVAGDDATEVGLWLERSEEEERDVASWFAP